MSLSDKEFKRLLESIKWSQMQLSDPRENRLAVIKQFVGSHYAAEGAARNVPVNMLKLALDIYVRSLAARAPRVLITTAIAELKPTAANLQLAVNQIPKEIRLASVFRRFVTEALFSIGVVKVGLHSVGVVADHEYGEPFVDVITLDDYFCDMTAKSFDQIQYEGNDYWVSLDELKKMSWLKKEDRAALMGEGHTNPVLNEDGSERAESISRQSTAEEFKQRVHLRDVWLPDRGLMITYSVQEERRLNEVELDIPGTSPYYKLGFTDVPGNLLPLPPVAIWRDLHELANALFRKLGRQADSQKTVLGFPGGDDDGVQAFKGARDGEGINYTAGKPETLTAGGIDPTTLAFYLQVKELSSYFGGNLDTLGGLAPMTETIGQDKLLGESAGAQMRDMASKTVEVVREIFRALAYYEWNDPVKTRTLEKPIPGMNESHPVDWRMDTREGDFDSYDLDIDVYSQMDDSPQLKLQRLGMIMREYVIPLMPVILQQNGQLDAQAILEEVAKLADFQELENIVTFAEPSKTPDVGPVAGKPASTTRQYDRVVRPGANPGGQSNALQQILVGGNPQKAEGSALG